jgi:aminoglycoside phosphotransferase (APT) family kinase protein
VTPVPGGDLRDWAEETARRYGGAAPDVAELWTSSQAVVLTCGDVVIKVHRPGTNADELAARLAFCAAPTGARLLLPPLELTPLAVPAGLVAAGESVGSLASVWPRVETVALDPETAPWEDAARLLAALHRLPVDDGADALPEHGAPVRLRRALDGLAAALVGTPGAAPAGEEVRAAAEVVRVAAAKLPDRAWTPSAPLRPRTVVHGDWHLGQLGRRAGGPWVLIDVDDLGLGDPVWDLARPAAFAAAGLLPDEDLRRFLVAYSDAGGPAVPVAPLDPWPALDPVARASVVQAAAAGVRRALAENAQLDDVDRVLVSTCAALAR